MYLIRLEFLGSNLSQDALKAEKEQLAAERDQLLAEKATWAEKPSTASDTANSGEVSISDAERAELAQARDTAQAQVKVSRPV